MESRIEDKIEEIEKYVSELESVKEAKGMRNIIAHDYGKVDDEIVFNVINEELIKDVANFINFIRQVI